MAQVLREYPVTGITESVNAHQIPTQLYWWLLVQSLPQYEYSVPSFPTAIKPD